MTDLTQPLPAPAPRTQLEDEPALTSSEAAAVLGITTGALRQRRHRGTAPPAHLTPNGWTYQPAELNQWLQENPR